MRIDLGYPDRDAERTLLQGADRRDMIAGLDASLAPGDLMNLQAAARLHPGARRALAALPRIRERPLAARRARAAARRARLGAHRRAGQGRPRGRTGGAPRGGRPSPAAGARRGAHLEPRQGERPDLRGARPVSRTVKLDRVLQYSQAYNFYQ